MTAGDYCPRCRGIHDILKDCVVPAPVDYGHWSTAQLALKAMTKERDALLLQLSEARRELELWKQGEDVKLADANRLLEPLQKIARAARSFVYAGTDRDVLQRALERAVEAWAVERPIHANPATVGLDNCAKCGHDKRIHGNETGPCYATIGKTPTICECEKYTEKRKCPVVQSYPGGDMPCTLVAGHLGNCEPR